jgi:hypothetical protein
MDGGRNPASSGKAAISLLTRLYTLVNDKGKHCLKVNEIFDDLCEKFDNICDATSRVMRNHPKTYRTLPRYKELKQVRIQCSSEIANVHRALMVEIDGYAKAKQKLNGLRQAEKKHFDNN